ncbi:MAG: DUF418 domain-containing protein [Acidobacteriota bacterium]
MKLSPTARSRRLHALDVLRGVAVFGILVVNVEQMFLPVSYANDPVVAVPGAWGSTFAWFFTDALFESKFLTLFSLLFGAGFALQWQRSGRGGKDFVPRFLRRLVLLGGFGFAHAALFYSADVLLIYALTAVLLIPWRRARARTLTIVGAVLLGLMMAWGTVISGPDASDTAARKRSAAQAVSEAREHGDVSFPELTLEKPERLDVASFPEWELIEEGRKIRIPATTYALPMPAKPALLMLDSGGKEHKALVEFAVLSQGPVHAAVGVRLTHFARLIMLILPLYLGWRTLALFLLGTAFVKSGRLTAEPTRFWHRARWIGLAVGVPLTLLASAIRLVAFESQSIWIYAGHLLHDASSLLLAAGIAGAVWLWASPGLRSLPLRSLAAVGRTALTNYIGQSAVMSILATSYGLGLYGSLSRLQLLGLALLCFVLQMIVSVWWLQRFRIGPLEWIWRCFTYWRLVPLRADTGSTAGNRPPKALGGGAEPGRGEIPSNDAP